jgi:hypothetical protein
MKPYARLMAEATEGRVVKEVADEWGVPRHVIDEALADNVRAPSAKYLPRVAQGMGFTIDELLAKLAPPEVKASTNGRPRSARKASPSIS